MKVQQNISANKFRVKCIFLFVLLFSQLSSVAQSIYRFRNYTINNGLSQSSVTSIIQDDQHAIWIGTQDGLNRFDGKYFEVFTSDDSEGLESEYIKCSVKSKGGNLWFGTTNGLTEYDPKTERFTTFTYGSNVPLQIESMSIDYNQTIWIGTQSNGLWNFNTKTKKFKSYQSTIPSKKIKLVKCVLQGSVFIETEDKGFFRYIIETNRTEKLEFTEATKSKPVVQCVTESKKGAVFIGTSNGIYRLNAVSRQLKPVYAFIKKRYGTVSVTDIYQSPDDTWFIATSNKGLITLLPSGKTINTTEDIFQKNALLFNDINILFQDDAGNMWAGTERGLSCFDPLNQGILGVGPSGNLSRGIPTPNVWSFAEGKKSKYVFIGTDVGVSRWDRATGLYDQFYRKRTESTVNEGTETSVLSLFTVNDNHLLVGCVDGLYELKITGKNAYSFTKVALLQKEIADRFNRIYSIAHWKDEQYFLATKGGVVLVDLKNKKSQVFEHQPKKPTKTITQGVCRLVFKGKDGRIWFATSTGELNVLSLKNEEVSIVPYKLNTYLTSKSKDYITSIYQSGPNTFWMGTFGSGLMYWNEKTKEVRTFTKKEGLPNNVVYAVVNGGDGRLWLSTNKGICSFHPSTKKIAQFTEQDGLMSNEFNIGAYMKGSSGELFFGGIYGFNYFKPAELNNVTNTISVIFTKFKLDKGWQKPNEKGSPLTSPIAQTSELELSYRQRSFAIRFQPSDLGNPETVNYKYVLLGSDEGEITIGNVNELRFSSLSPGEYELLLYARIGTSEWGIPTALKINIRPPFWGSWWFWTIVTLLVAIGVRLVVRQRIESERREQVRLEMKIAERTREIRQQNEKITKQSQQLEEEKNKVVEQQRLLQIEKDKTEKLLQNVIPATTAEELKRRGKVSARAYKTVSVLFTDFVGFTKIAEHMNPTELVGRLDFYFRKFDEIIVNNGLEKIKTIGDAYMCAGGVPVRNNTNPIDTCLAAVQIQDFMHKMKNEAIANHTDFWELRLGINTGEVTAGVIGSERLAFDVWGATVNHAQRMEMLGEPGKVTITGSTFKHIEPYFECVFRGKAQTKSRGILDMYTVERIKPELSINGDGVYPNERFQQIVNLHLYSSINYYKAERHIMKVLQKGLTDKLHYHSIKHTQDVVKAVERLALMEGVTDEGLFLLKSAATYHDAGFVEQYDRNEPVGARLAEEILPKYGYTNQHIETIKELIYATQIPHQPKNKLEEIICDADLDYLGRDDFHEIADKLRRELREHGKLDSDRKWDEIQVQFLTSHRYFTETAIQTRRPKKLKNLQEVIDRLDRNEYVD